MPGRHPRQPRSILPLSMATDPDYVRTQTAAAKEGMTLSEYARAAIRQRNALVLDDGPELSRTATPEFPVSANA